MMAQKVLPKFFLWIACYKHTHTHGSLVHEFYEHAHFLVFITLSLSVFTSLLRALAALDSLRCCVYKISCELARKRIVTRLQAIWSLIYVSFFLFHSSRRVRSFQRKQVISKPTKKFNAYEVVHARGRPLVCTMEKGYCSKRWRWAREREMYNERCWLYVLVHSANLWLWRTRSMAVALFNFGSRRENAQIKMEHIKKEKLLSA